MVRDLVVPAGLHTSLAAAVAVQIATGSLGIARQDAAGLALLAAGLLLFAATAVLQLRRFRRANGVRLADLAGQVVLGSATLASLGYAAGLAGATWAAFAGAWWVVPLAAAAGGLAYGESGRRWVRRYRQQPVQRGRTLDVALLVVAAVAGLVLLVVAR
ncbi:hypothetical protein GCM10025868_26630 [Angustibacter aerolatus]|uniref:Uncharacterized protein n=1 Tax=Angustibacter aerolatus TaxID=1162965 RepID=A0ABQ6JGU0_9ACTN|nr:hypothetical protein [Angustibacter aerolatus]GMA87413.1 hypothetical protein GCM10025868_26630 [Angustibacter aerolatus]